MTISNQTVEVVYVYTIPGVTEFNITFDYFDATQVHVYKIDTNVNPDTITEIEQGAGAAKFTVIAGPKVKLGTALAAGEKIIVRRETPLTQSADYDETRAFPFADHEEQMDRFAMMAQEQSTAISKKIGLDEASTTTTPVFPEPVSEGVVRWNAAMDGLEAVANADLGLTASDIANVPAGNVVSTNVQAAINELDTDLAAHLADMNDPHNTGAFQVSNVPAGNLAATDVQAALNELQGDIDTANTNHSNHIADTGNPHSVTAAQVGNSVAQWNADKLQGKTVDLTGIADGNSIEYDLVTDKFIVSTAMASSKVDKGGDTMTGDLTMGGGSKVIGNLQGNADTATVGTNNVLKSGDTMTGELVMDGAGIQFDPALANPAHSEGRVFYDQNKKALSVYNDSTAITHNLGRESLVRVFNDTGVTIPNGKAVYGVGPHVDSEGTTKVALARADAAATYETYIGITTMDIPDGQYGEVTAWGDVSDMDTTPWAAGDMLYLSDVAAGELTTTPPMEPSVKIHVGCVRVIHATDGKLYVNKERHNALSKQDKFNGVEDPTKFSIAYNAETRVVTITGAAGAGVWVNGVRYSKVGVEALAAHAGVTGKYYVYYNSSGNLVVTDTVWSLTTTAQLFLIYYKHNATPALAKAMIFDERHPAQTGMSNAIHRYLHEVLGTQLHDGGNITGYVVGVGGAANLSYAISAAELDDEDIHHNVGAQTEGGTYMHLYVDNPAGTWNWVEGANSGILTDGTNIQYNDITTGALTAVAVNNRWINYWPISLPFYATVAGAVQTAKSPGYAIIVGQTLHTTLPSAQSHTPSNLQFIENFTDEGVVFAKIIYRRDATVAPGNAYVAENHTNYRGSIVTLSGSFTATDHQSLSNRNALNSHPATAISTDVTNFNGILSATEDTVQKALDKLDDGGGGRYTTQDFDDTTVVATNAGMQRWRAAFTTPRTVTTFTLGSMVDASLLMILGTSNTNSVAVSQTATGIVSMNGDWEGGTGHALVLMYDSAMGGLIEVSRT